MIAVETLTDGIVPVIETYGYLAWFVFIAFEIERSSTVVGLAVVAAAGATA
ncbi:hypothetical protein [Salinigranum sp. GCM10025319]|uniref:hypothetical protein n=1 Tax=Salinigranum sp. GCM10025319 TaxID=3252687 RepID=UPI00361BAAF7